MSLQGTGAPITESLSACFVAAFRARKLFPPPLANVSFLPMAIFRRSLIGVSNADKFKFLPEPCSRRPLLRRPARLLRGLPFPAVGTRVRLNIPIRYGASPRSSLPRGAGWEWFASQFSAVGPPAGRAHQLVELVEQRLPQGKPHPTSPF